MYVANYITSYCSCACMCLVLFHSTMEEWLVLMIEVVLSVEENALARGFIGEFHRFPETSQVYHMVS